LKQPLAGPEGVEKGVAGEKWGGRSEKCRVSSDQRRKIAAITRVAEAVIGFCNHIHLLRA